MAARSYSPVMARIQFDYSGDYGFTTELQVYISHVNYGGHLDNAQLLTLVSEARLRFFLQLGYHEAAVEGLAIVVGDQLAVYKSEAFHGETLRIAMAATDLGKYGFDLVFQMREATSGREVARGKVGIVFIDPATKKVARLPPPFVARLQALAASASGDG